MRPYQDAQGALLLLLRHGRIRRGARLREAHQRRDHALEQVGTLQVAVVIHEEVHLQGVQTARFNLSRITWHTSSSKQTLCQSPESESLILHWLLLAHQQLAVASKRLKAPQHHAALAQVHWRRRCRNNRTVVSVPGHLPLRQPSRSRAAQTDDLHGVRAN